MIKRYEINYLVAPDLPQEELRALQSRIEDAIHEENGSLIEVNNPVGKVLARPIKAKLQPKTGTASLISSSFTLSTDKLFSLEQKIRKPIDSTPKEQTDLKKIEEKLEEILENI